MKIESERLILREWQETDVDDLVEGLNDLEVSKWLAFVPYPYTEKAAKRFIAASIEESKAESRNTYELAIVLKSENKVIGGLSLDNVSRRNKTAGGGIWINAKYHGYGYGSEAFAKRAEYAFDVLELRRLENGYYPDNEFSWRMQEKLGYKKEGLKRKSYICQADGIIKDEVITGLLKEEWVR